MKIYHMIIQRKDDTTGETRQEYLSKRQGAAPVGWKCVGVCGYHESREKKSENLEYRRNDGLQT